MLDKIAVTCTDTNDFSSFAESRQITIYKKNGQTWQPRKIVPFQINPNEQAEAFRDQIRNLILKLDGCRILVTIAIGGLAYHVFDRMNFSIFVTPALHPNEFDQIIRDIENSTQPFAGNDAAPKTPVQTQAGIYFLDLIELQKAYPDISSKKALQPFLRQTPFLRLDLLCSHLPPWLETPEYKDKYDIVCKADNTARFISITPKLCRS